jgi:hypothetical protein
MQQKLVAPALQPLGGCGDVAKALRDRAVAAMNDELNANLERALKEHRQICRPVPVPGPVAQPGLPPPPAAPPATSAPGAANPNAGGGATERASMTSMTNNQVAGVDEPDFVKNDDRYIYFANGRELRIVQAWPPTEARVLSRVSLPGTADRLFVAADRAVVYLATGDVSQERIAPGSRPVPGRRACTYGYDCEFGGDGRPWTILVYDISDRARPVLLRELRTTSSLVTARRVGNAIHSVLVKEAPPLTRVEAWPPEVTPCNGSMSDAQIIDAFERLRARNLRMLEQADNSLALPSVTDVVYDPQTGTSSTSNNLLASCPGFYRESGPAGFSFTTVLSIDMAKTSAPSLATIFSRAGAVYASGQSLYMAVRQQQQARQPWFLGWENQTEVTTVHKFQLEQASSRFVASGAVKGRVLNQFAMDEHGGNLRIASTTGRLPSPDVHSTLSVLGPGEDAQLQRVGVVDKLAPGEDIRSCRFDGDRGYVVTFKKTDPLFVFDLANPRSPRVLAELKIPGFSTYIHRMDDRHLLTIGYDADDQGSFAFFTGVLLQIFDVGDPRNPRLAHKYTIGTRGSSSEALTNHLAFTYFAPKNLLLLPMTICEEAGPSIFQTRPTFSGLLAFEATTSTGFEEQGRVGFSQGPEVTCGNWWTQASSQVRRSIVMDDFVYSITDRVLKASNLSSLATPVATVNLD